MMNRFFRTAVAALAGLLCVSAALAQDVAVSTPWVRATVPQQPATGAFMKLSAPRGARVVEVRSPVAASVEIHEMTMQGEVMQMRALSVLELPAGRTLELRPGGHHLMLMGLKQQLKEGDSVPLSLVVETGGQRQTIEIKAPVRAVTAQKH